MLVLKEGGLVAVKNAVDGGSRNSSAAKKSECRRLRIRCCALLGIAALAAEDLGCDQEETMAFFGCGDPGAGGYVVGALLLGGIGSAVGVGIDALIRRDPEIYRRVGGPRVSLAPTIGRHKRGAAVSISW